MTPADHAAVCSGKSHFLTWEQAHAVKKKLQRSISVRPGRYLNIYRCPACGQFVLGTAFREGRRKKRELHLS